MSIACTAECKGKKKKEKKNSSPYIKDEYKQEGKLSSRADVPMRSFVFFFFFRLFVSFFN